MAYISETKEADIIRMAKQMSIEAVANVLNVDVFDVRKTCVKYAVSYTTASELRARYEVLTYKLMNGIYSEDLVKERNEISLKLYRQNKRKVERGGLEERSIDNYLTD